MVSVQKGSVGMLVSVQSGCACEDTLMNAVLRLSNTFAKCCIISLSVFLYVRVYIHAHTHRDTYIYIYTHTNNVHMHVDIHTEARNFMFVRLHVHPYAPRKAYQRPVGHGCGQARGRCDGLHPRTLRDSATRKPMNQGI